MCKSELRNVPPYLRRGIGMHKYVKKKKTQQSLDTLMEGCKKSKEEGKNPNREGVSEWEKEKRRKKLPTRN